MRFRRPEVYFDADKSDADGPKWPAVIELPLEMPDPLPAAYGSADDAREAIKAALQDAVREAHAEARRQRKGFIGVARVLRTPHTARGNSYEEFGARVPRFAAAGDREAAQLAIAARRLFVAAYREARAAFLHGVRDVLWPAGTWVMRVLYGMHCAEPPS